jgi:hypothetical protein
VTFIFETYIGDCLVTVEAKIHRNYRADIVCLTIDDKEFPVDSLNAKALQRLEDEADEKAAEVQNEY